MADIYDCILDLFRENKCLELWLTSWQLQGDMSLGHNQGLYHSRNEMGRYDHWMSSRDIDILYDNLILHNLS